MHRIEKHERSLGQRGLRSILSDMNILSRVFPFALFMCFVGLDEVLFFMRDKGIIAFTDQDIFSLYPLRALAAGGMLFFFRELYREVRLPELLKAQKTLVSVTTGVLVFSLWIHMGWPFGAQTAVKGFNPMLFEQDSIRMGMIGLRLLGAVIVVPIMEELFWRSFFVRYVVRSDFMKVPIGQFTWPSFLITVFLFGLEHTYLYAGIMAGVAYSMLLYHTKSVTHCILAHAVTNLLLGLYVLSTGYWHFW